MALAPVASCVPATVRVAVAVPPVPVRFADPKAVLFTVKLTAPVGEAVPLEAFTVAVNTVLLFIRKLAGLALTVVVVALDVRPPHAVTRLNASTDPNPVARSYPGPALKPRVPFTQFGEAATQGTELLPTVTS